MPVCSAAKCSVRDALLLRRRRYYVEIPPYLANSNWEADALSEGQVPLRSQLQWLQLALPKVAVPGTFQCVRERAGYFSG